MPRFIKGPSLHGQRAYITTGGDKFVTKGGVVAGGELSVGRKGGNIVFPSPDTVALFDDFLGDLVADEWNYVEGDTGHAGAVAPVAAGGVYRITVSATAPTAPTAYAGINGGVVYNWKTNQGSLRMAARLKISALTSGENVFVGLTDTGAGEMPIHDTGAGAISTATNAVGFFHGGQASQATGWAGVAVNAGTDATPVAGNALTANTYDVLEMFIGDTGGNGDGDRAYFYQNGTLLGSISNPVLATRNLTPAVVAFSSDTGGFNVDIDWINVSANRDTGL